MRKREIYIVRERVRESFVFGISARVLYGESILNISVWLNGFPGQLCLPLSQLSTALPVQTIR